MSRYKISNPSKNEGVVSIDGKWTTLEAGKVIFSDRKPGDHTKNIKVSVMASNLKSTVNMPKAASTGSLRVASKADAAKFSEASASASPASTIRVVRAAAAAVEAGSESGDADSGEEKSEG